MQTLSHTLHAPRFCSASLTFQASALLSGYLHPYLLSVSPTILPRAHIYVESSFANKEMLISLSAAVRFQTLCGTVSRNSACGFPPSDNWEQIFFSIANIKHNAYCRDSKMQLFSESNMGEDSIGTWIQVGQNGSGHMAFNRECHKLIMHLTNALWRQQVSGLQQSRKSLGQVLGAL